jgi:hypothetical protein
MRQAMTIADFYEKHGLEGLRRLAAGAGTDLSYIRALLYSPNKNPSLKMAIALVRASENELTYVGLAFPQGVPEVAAPQAAPALAAG